MAAPLRGIPVPRPLLAGAAEAPITPPAGVELSGYSAREGPSLGVHDDLWCRALVADDGAARIALVSLDLLGLDFALDGALRQAAAEAGEVPPEAVLLNCSHTHAGPAVQRLPTLGVPESSYVASLPRRVAEVVRAAAGRRRPVVLSYGEAPGRVGINRREWRPDGGVVIGSNPGGLVDEVVRVVQVSDEEGVTIALLFSHACHGTTLGAANRMISAEWMGAACESIRGQLDEGAVPVFLQGCAGHTNPEKMTRSFQVVGQLGARAAEAALRAMAAAAPMAGAPLGARLERIELPLQDSPDAPIAEARVAQAERDFEQARREGATATQVHSLQELVNWHRHVLSLARQGARALTLPFAVQALRLGDLALVGLSGEVFLEFALQIAAGSPFRHTLVLGYSNGCVGYVCTPEAIAEGGYEPEVSFYHYRSLPLAPEAGAVMVEAALRLLGELRAG